jgi:hypothetical protein
LCGAIIGKWARIAAVESDPKSLPVGTPSAVETASQPTPHRVLQLGAVGFSSSVGSIVLTLTLASQHLLAHARTLAAKAEAEFHQMAVVFAHAACELHTEWALNRLIDSRSDKELGDLARPGETEVTSLTTERLYQVYSKLADDYPKGKKELQRTTADWWEPWLASRRDRHAVAHRGAQMTKAQADAAIAVADRYIEHLTKYVEAAIKRPP